MTSFLTVVDNESMQIAKQADEATPATTGFKILKASSLVPKREGKFDTFQAAGNRHVTANRQNTAHTTFALSGAADYNEFGFWANMALSIAASALNSGDLATYKHIWTPFSAAPNPVNYYTIEWGNDAYLRRAIGCRLDSFGFKSVRTGKAEINGSGFGKKMLDSLRDGITKTSGGVAIPTAQLTGVDVACKIASTYAGLAAAPVLTDSFALEWMLSAIAAAVFTHNRNLSYEGNADQKDQKGTAKAFVPVTDAYMDVLTDLEQGEFQFFRIEAIGPIVDATDATPYSLTIDTCVTIDKPAEEKGEQNVLGIEFPFIWARDPLVDRATRVELVNAIASY